MLERLLKPYIDKGLCVKRKEWPYRNYYILKQGTFCQGSECVTISFVEKTKDFILVFGFHGIVYYMFLDDHNLADEITNTIDNYDWDIEAITNALLELIFTKNKTMQIKYSLK